MAASADAGKEFLEHLCRSEIYQEYKHAFGAATDLPIALHPVLNWQRALRDQHYENPFCALMAKASRKCALCLEIQGTIINLDETGEQTAHCFAGLTHTAVPVRMGERIVGVLVTGKVALTPPTRAKFKRMAVQIAELGVSADLAQMEEAYLRSRTLKPEQYNAMVRLLEIFGRNLSAAANQVALQESESEPPLVRRARAFITGHAVDPLTLGQAAAALHVSTFHFCKIFKKGTGLTFTDYLGRVRVEKAKSMLVNPNLRVTEIAYATGFQSLTHFNRLFSKLVGSSPTIYRASLPRPRPRGKDEG